MDDKLYLIDESAIDYISEEFHQFFTDFMSDNAVAIITDKPASAIADSWIMRCKYIFASDGNEVFINGKLRYCSNLVLTPEAEKWIASTTHIANISIASVHVFCDPYASAALVREFNELFAEFRAHSCSGGFRITTANHSRRHCVPIIDPNYAIRIIATVGSYGGSNFELVNALRGRATTFYASKTSELHELLQYFLEK